ARVCATPRPKSAPKPRSSAASRRETRKWPWAGCWATWPTVDRKKECVMFHTEDVRFPAEGRLTTSHRWPQPSEAGFVVLLHEQRHRRETMAKVTYDTQLTALLVIDPYNDFMSEGGQVRDRLKSVAEANQCVPHMMQVLAAARKAHIRVFYALHHQYRPGDYETWKYMAPVQKAAWAH